MPRIVLIAHNLRSTHNVGSILRTADGLGVHEVLLTGYTPYPSLPNDPRLPHIHAKLTRQIHKTALGAETSQAWRHVDDISDALAQLRTDGYMIAALEQAPRSISLSSYEAPDKLAIILGREVEGVEADVLDQADLTLEISMHGRKESFNVSIAAAIAAYHCLR